MSLYLILLLQTRIPIEMKGPIFLKQISLNNTQISFHISILVARYMFTKCSAETLKLSHSN